MTRRLPLLSARWGCTALALAAIGACSGGQGSDDGAPSRDAGSFPGGPNGGGDSGSPGPGDIVDVCPSGIPSMNTLGVFSAPLVGPVLAFSELGALGRERYVSRIALFDGGVLVGSSGGFWEITGAASPRWIAEDGVVRSFLVADFDADETDDVVTFGQAVHASEGMAAYRNKLALWEGINDAFVRRSDADPSNNEVDDQFGAGDVDGDGILDLATLSLGTPMLYRVDGAFGLASETAGPALELTRGGAAVRGVSLFDADGDGALDLVAALDNSTSGTDELFVAFLRGDGHGAFGEAIISVIGGASLMPVTPAADVTGDGVADVVSWKAGDDRYTLQVAQGRGDGRFDPAADVYEGTGSNAPWSVVAADTDGDGAKEIVGVTQQGILVLRSNGALTFEADLHAVPYGVQGIAVRDATASSPALLHALLSVSNCLPECGNACEGQCLLGVCVELEDGVADADGGA